MWWPLPRSQQLQKPGVTGSHAYTGHQWKANSAWSGPEETSQDHIALLFHRDLGRGTGRKQLWASLQALGTEVCCSVCGTREPGNFGPALRGKKPPVVLWVALTESLAQSPAFKNDILPGLFVSLERDMATFQWETVDSRRPFWVASSRSLCQLPLYQSLS